MVGAACNQLLVPRISERNGIVNFSAFARLGACFSEDLNKNKTEARTMTPQQFANAETSFPSAISLPALRKGASRHPMALFAIAATVAILSISVPSRTLDAGSATPPVVEQTESIDEMPLLPKTEVELACEGQIWGSETQTCLMAIAKDGGKDQPARIRTISGA